MEDVSPKRQKKRHSASHSQLKTLALKNLLICSPPPQNSLPQPLRLPLSPWHTLLTTPDSRITLLTTLSSSPTGLNTNGTSMTSSLFSFQQSLPLILVSGASASSHVPARNRVSSKLNSDSVRLCDVIKVATWDASRRRFSASMVRRWGKCSDWSGYARVRGQASGGLGWCRRCEVGREMGQGPRCGLSHRKEKWCRLGAKRPR